MSVISDEEINDLEEPLNSRNDLHDSAERMHTEDSLVSPRANPSRRQLSVEETEGAIPLLSTREDDLVNADQDFQKGVKMLIS